jgi:CheY-like chemotaxis protein
VGADENILVVDDEVTWCDIFRRTIAAQGDTQTVKVAYDLVSATSLIRATQFAVAFVDIGLDVSDIENRDGLRVMERIRAVGDRTSIVVVTARSGQDVLSITRDAIKKYNAYDVIGKGRLMPSDIRRLLEDGRSAFMAASDINNRALGALQGTVDAKTWQRRVMQAVGFNGDAASLDSFLDGLLNNYLPVVRLSDERGMNIDSKLGLVYGRYWSRAIGAAVLICFGASEDYAKVVRTVYDHAMLLGNRDIQSQATEISEQGLRGGVFVLKEI